MTKGILVQAASEPCEPVVQPACQSGVVLHTRVVSQTGGGPEKTILNSPRFLQPHGYRVSCAYMHPVGDPGFEQLQARAEAAQARLISIPDRGAWDLSVARRLLKICRQEKVDLWHAHDYKSNALGLLLRRFHRMKLVTTVHGWVKHTRRTPLYYWIDRRCLPRYDHVVCVSQDLYDQCLRCGVRPQRLSLVQNAIDTDDFTRHRSPQEAKVRLGFAPDRLLLGAVGRLSEEKGFDWLIRLAQALLREGLPLSVVIVGEGEQRPALERLIAENGLQEHVRLAGFQENVRDFYEAMDVFALTSRREGLPNVVLEAMALETPVVATRVAGIPALVQHEHNGLVVEIDHHDQMLAALRRALTDPLLRRCLAAQARSTVEEKFTFAQRMAKIRAIYQQLLSM